MKILLTPQLFAEILPAIGGNLDVDFYVPSIRVAQEIKVKPTLGRELYKKIETDFIEDNLDGDYLTLYEDFVQYLIAYSAAEHFVSIHPYKIGNSGISKVTSENLEAAEKKEIDFLVQNYRNIYEHFATQTIAFLNEVRFPEYPVNIKPVNNLVGGWFLESKSERIRDLGLPRNKYSVGASFNSDKY